MCVVFHICATSYAQDSYCTFRPERESWRRGATGPFKRFVLIRKLQHRKTKAFFCFSPSSLPGLGLQETAFCNPKLLQGKFHKYLSAVAAATTRPVGSVAAVFGAERGRFFLSHNAPMTRNCSANTNRVQPDGKDTEKLTPQVHRCPSSRIPAAIVDRAATVRTNPVGWCEVNGLRGI